MRDQRLQEAALIAHLFQLDPVQVLAEDNQIRHDARRAAAVYVQEQLKKQDEKARQQARR